MKSVQRAFSVRFAVKLRSERHSFVRRPTPLLERRRDGAQRCSLRAQVISFRQENRWHFERGVPTPSSTAPSKSAGVDRVRRRTARCLDGQRDLGVARAHAVTRRRSCRTERCVLARSALRRVASCAAEPRRREVLVSENASRLKIAATHILRDAPPREPKSLRSVSATRVHGRGSWIEAPSMEVSARAKFQSARALEGSVLV